MGRKIHPMINSEKKNNQRRVLSKMVKNAAIGLLAEHAEECTEELLAWVKRWRTFCVIKTWPRVRLQSPDCTHSQSVPIGFIKYITPYKSSKFLIYKALCCGGDGGNRNRVRTSIHTVFYERIASFRVPPARRRRKGCAFR